MTGVLINVLAVVVGGALGLLLKKGIPERFSDIVMKGVGLCVLYIGISGVLEGKNTLVLIISTVVGAVLGELMRLDDGIHSLAEKLELATRRWNKGGKIAEGFVTASLLFCVGAMAIVGSLSAGLTGDNEVLITKSTLDFISSIIFASALGFGVLLSAGFILVYQGAIALLSSFIAPLLDEYVVGEMTCVGSLLIIGLGLNMLGLTKLKVMNYVPAIFLPILLCMLLKA